MGHGAASNPAKSYVFEKTHANIAKDQNIKDPALVRAAVDVDDAVKASSTLVSSSPQLACMTHSASWFPAKSNF
jgi:hypothetical protein